MKYSVIVPVKDVNDDVLVGVKHFLDIHRDDVEMIILPNENLSGLVFEAKNISVVNTGKVYPGIKRDKGAALSSGEILVFMDDDSFVSADYFSRLDKYAFEHPNVAVGGPAIDPPEASFFQNVSGAFFLCDFGGGVPERYRSKGKKRIVDDWPSVNLVITKKAYKKINGFGSDYWPGEDSHFCEKVNKAGFKITYLPDLIAYHKRRGSLFEHIKQVYNYGKHRGYFAYKGFKNSRRIFYFLPSIFFVVSLFLALFDISTHKVGYLSILLICAYSFALVHIAVQSVWFKNVAVAIAVIPVAYLSHNAYGVAFILGALRRNITSQLR